MKAGLRNLQLPKYPAPGVPLGPRNKESIAVWQIQLLHKVAVGEWGTQPAASGALGRRGTTQRENP